MSSIDDVIGPEENFEDSMDEQNAELSENFEMQDSEMENELDNSTVTLPKKEASVLKRFNSKLPRPDFGRGKDVDEDALINELNNALQEGGFIEPEETNQEALSENENKKDDSQ